MTILNFVHDEDFEIRPNEPKLIIGVHWFGKNGQKPVKYDHFRQLMELLITLL